MQSDQKDIFPKKACKWQTTHVKCSILLIVGDTQIKILLSYHSTLTKMSIISKRYMCSNSTATSAIFFHWRNSICSLSWLHQFAFLPMIYISFVFFISSTFTIVSLVDMLVASGGAIFPECVWGVCSPHEGQSWLSCCSIQQGAGAGIPVKDRAGSAQHGSKAPLW